MLGSYQAHNHTTTTTWKLPQTFYLSLAKANFKRLRILVDPITVFL